MESGPLISVITVCYNSAATLERTLQSVADQDYKRIEHIVIDGASTDGTMRLVEEHGQHLAAIISEPDEGIYDAMNKGLELATGDIICFLNSDDHYSHSNVLLEVAQKFKSYEVDALFGDAIFFDPDEPSRVIRHYSSKHFSPRKLSWGWMPAHPALFFRKHIYDCYGRYKIDYRIAGDFDLIARIFKDGDIKFHYFPEVIVRMATGGISTRGWRSTLILNQEILRACHENNIDTCIYKILCRYPKKIFEYIKL
jgi:glycosyltransferase involved in cell wall biosynthesis